MRVLAVDTTLAACSVAAAADGCLLARIFEPLARGHAERLVPMLEAVRREAGLAYGGFDCLAVTIGPGSFAGVRVGLSAVRALALVEGLPALGIGTMTALAWSETSAVPLLVAIDARRGEVYAQLFDTDREPVSPPRLLPVEDAPALAAGAPGLLLGSASGLLLPALPDWRASEAGDLPDAGVLARRCSRWGKPAAGPPPRPLYLRAPDAKLPAAPP